MGIGGIFSGDFDVWEVIFLESFIDDGILQLQYLKLLFKVFDLRNGDPHTEIMSPYD